MCVARAVTAWCTSVADVGCMTRPPAYMHTHPLILTGDETIGLEGARAIGGMLQLNSTLTYLDISCKQPPLLVFAGDWG